MRKASGHFSSKKSDNFLLNCSPTAATAVRPAPSPAAAAAPRGGAAARQAGPAGAARGTAADADVAGRAEAHHQAAGGRRQHGAGVQFNRHFCRSRIRPRTRPKSCLEFSDISILGVPYTAYHLL